MDSTMIVITLVVTGLVTCLIALLSLRRSTRARASQWSSETLFYADSERSFIDPSTSKTVSFPTDMIRTLAPKDFSPHQDQIDLSVVVPAFNEESRLPHMLDEALEFLEGRAKRSKSKFSYELIVVDDGSGDRTSQRALQYSKQYGADKVRVMTLAKNRGKGGAVRLGVLVSRGRRIMFADADGASKFSEIDKLDRYIDQHERSSKSKLPLILAIGSRSHLEKEAIATRSLFRTILMKGFHCLVWSACVRSVNDTQCGFKMFTRTAAYVIFNAYHNQSWAFDVELLYIAEQLGCQIGEIPISWQEIEGSKIVPVFSWLKMGRDVLMIAAAYTLGIYRVPDPIHDSQIK